MAFHSVTAKDLDESDLEKYGAFTTNLGIYMCHSIVPILAISVARLFLLLYVLSIRGVVNPLTGVLCHVFEGWLYFAFGSEEGEEVMGHIVPEEDGPADGHTAESDVFRNNSPIGSLGDRHPMAALANIL